MLNDSPHNRISNKIQLSYLLTLILFVLTKLSFNLLNLFEWCIWLIGNGLWKS